MMNYLKRRFSSGDLQNDFDENVMTIPTTYETQMRMPTQQEPSYHRPSKSTSYTSAPSSPTRSLSFANQFINVARGVVNQAIQQIPQQTPTNPGSTAYTPVPHSYPSNHPQQLSSVHQRDSLLSGKEKCKFLLVIDDPHTDW
jgi:hypothetical protein